MDRKKSKEIRDKWKIAKDELKESIRQFKSGERTAPNFLAEYTIYKKILDIYMKRTEQPLKNMKMATNVYIANQRELTSIYKELYELVKTVNPKFLNYDNPKLQEKMNEIKKLLDVLEVASNGLKGAENL